MSRPAGLAFTALAVLIAGALITYALSGSRVVFRLVVVLFGLAFLTATLLSLAELGRRAHQLVRLLLTPTRGVDGVTDLPTGSQWIRIEAPFRARDETIGGVLDSTSAVAHTTRIRKREALRGVPKFSTPTGVDRDETDAVTFEFGESGALFTAEVSDGEPGFRVVGGEKADLTADDEVPPRTATALAARDADPDTHVRSGYAFEHFLRVREAEIPDGATGYLFGPVRVEEDGDRVVLRPTGRSQTLMTPDGWGSVARHVARRLVVLVALTPVAAIGSLLLLSMAF